MSRRKRINLFIIALTFLLITGCSRCDGGKAPGKTPPPMPDRISITAVSASEVKISWQPAAGNTGVKGYKIYRNGQYLKSTEASFFSDTGLQVKIKYCYRVSAYDAAGNESAQSTDVCAIL
jgi:chitinase